MTRLKGKIMTHDCVSITEPDHMPVSSSVTWDYYANFLHPKFHHNWSQAGVLILHDNARHHNKQTIETVFTQLQSESTISPHLIVLIQTLINLTSSQG